MAEKRSDVRQSLIDQLKVRGAEVPLYVDLIDQYMWFRQQLAAMRTDIAKRGRTYTTISAQGKDYEKNNPSVKDALMYSKQMVAIIDALNLSTNTVKTGKGDADEGDL